MFVYILSVLLTIVLIKCAINARKFWKHWKIIHKVPAPPERFPLGHMYLLTKPSDQAFNELRNCSKSYYPIYRYSTPILHIVHFLDPSDIKIILSTTNHLSKSRVYTFLENWLGTGLLTSTGEKWHQRRKILTPAFHFTILNEFLTIFNEETAQLVQKLDQIMPENGIIDVVPPVTQFTLQSIAETAMGFTSMDETTKKNYKQELASMIDILLRRLLVPSYRIRSIYRLSKLSREEDRTVKKLHDFSTRIISEREQAHTFAGSLDNYSKKKRLAMLDLLLTAKRNGADIDYEGIREEVDTFMFEGHDTTAMGISFLLMVLANVPEVQQRVLEEILAVVGNDTPTFAHLQELKYTERVIKETLRLFPSVPFISRSASEDFTTTTGYFIPKDTILHVHIFDVHRDENIYPDPLKFDPDRFLPEVANERHPFAYIPFSAGPRNCIGQRFALLELKAAVCGVVRKFKLEKIDDFNDMKFKLDLVLRPTHPLKVKFSYR